MPVPKATVNKECCSIALDNEIRFPRKRFELLLKGEIQRPETLFHSLLGRGIGRANARHHSTARLMIEGVHGIRTSVLLVGRKIHK